MGTPTYTPLANITLGSSASSVTFSSIPATYRDLVLVIDNAKTSTDQQFGFRYNGDTGANYVYVAAAGNSSGTTSLSSAGSNENRIGNINTTASNHIIQIMDYSATDKHKTSLARSNDAGRSQTWMFANRWTNTAAITSLSVKPADDGFVAGATFALYGIAS